MNITKGEILGCMAAGTREVEAVVAATGASTLCGSCRPLLGQLCGAPATSVRPVGSRPYSPSRHWPSPPSPPPSRCPRIGMASSVESWWYRVDVSWRDTVVKQITGYSLMTLFLVGLLVSLRKRLRWFRFGHLARWRLFHAAFGLAIPTT